MSRSARGRPPGSSARTRSIVLDGPGSTRMPSRSQTPITRSRPRCHGVDQPRRFHGRDRTGARARGRWRGRWYARVHLESAYERAPPARARSTVGDAHLRRPLRRPPLERALPAQPRQGPDRPLDRVRPADPDRLRPRRRARPRRGRQGRRLDRPSRRHGGAPRRHPARRDEHVDDDQRHRGLAARPLRRGRRRAGRARGRRSRARPRTTSSRSTSRAARTRSRRGRRCG